MSSVSAAIAGQPTALSPSTTNARRERRFFTGIAIAMAVVCFVGFAPSYYLKTQFGTPALKPLVHMHGLAFTMWMLLLIVQSALIANGRVRLHRQLGIGGVVLAVAMVVLGAAVAYIRGKTVTPGMPHEALLGFLAIAATALVIFAALVGAAVYFRRNAGVHKRLMILATTVILAAAVHRLLMRVIAPDVAPPVFFGATDLFIVALGVYDLISRGRVHAATVWGGLAILASQAGSILLAGSTTWLAFAHWITGT
jgi:hypothetical protein